MTLNADTVFHASTPPLLDTLVAYMDSNPRVGAAGPRLQHPNGGWQRSAYSFALPAIAVKPLRVWPRVVAHPWVAPYLALLHNEHLDFSAPRTTDWLLGAAVMMRQEALDVVGAFDPRYWLYFDDCDLCHTLWERGWEVHFVPTVTLTHTHQRAAHSERSPFVHFFKSRAARAHVKSWLQYLWKWRGRHRSYAHT
jgi:GT2 family glycosyltransferase